MRRDFAIGYMKGTVVAMFIAFLCFIVGSVYWNKPALLWWALAVEIVAMAALGMKKSLEQR